MLKKTVALVGMMGAGKTSVGRAVAASLNVAFLDSDEEIARAATMSIPEIFARDGEAFFRAREREVIARLIDGPPAILSTGGGAYLDPSTRALISQRAVALWLDADVDLLWERVRHRNTRPLLKTENPRATLEGLFHARVPHYAQAELKVKATPGLSVAGMAARVVGELQACETVWENNRR